MKNRALGLFLVLCSCESVPPAPPLPAPVSFQEMIADSSFERRNEITVDEGGKIRLVVRRSLLRDIRRSGQLSPDQMRELETLLDRWAGSTVLPPATAQPWGILQYGDRKVSWAKGVVPPLEVGGLTRWLREAAENQPLEPDRDRGR